MIGFWFHQNTATHAKKVIVEKRISKGKTFFQELFFLLASSGFLMIWPFIYNRVKVSSLRKIVSGTKVFGIYLPHSRGFFPESIPILNAAL